MILSWPSPSWNASIPHGNFRVTVDIQPKKRQHVPAVLAPQAGYRGSTLPRLEEYSFNVIQSSPAFGEPSPE